MKHLSTYEMRHTVFCKFWSPGISFISSRLKLIIYEGPTKSYYATKQYKAVELNKLPPPSPFTCLLLKKNKKLSLNTCTSLLQYKFNCNLPKLSYIYCFRSLTNLKLNCILILQCNN